MKILNVISSMNPALGGTIASVLELSKEFIRLGAEVSVVTSDPPQASYFDTPQAPQVMATGGRVLGKYSLSLSLLQWIKNNHHRFDRVLVHGLWQFHSVASLWALGEEAKDKLCVLTHGMLDPWFQKRYPLKHIKKLAYWILAERDVLNKARHVLFTCETERQRASQSFPFYSAREQVLPYGTQPPSPLMPEMSKAWFAKCPQVHDKPYLLFIGRVVEKKGVDLTLQAFAQAERDTARHLVIAGPAEKNYDAKLQALFQSLPSSVRQRVHWIPFVQGDEKWGALYHADAFVLHSHQENFGISVAEALACGVPVLLADGVNIASEIVQAKAGFASEPTVSGARKTLEQWRDADEATKAQMKQNALELFEQRYNLRTNAVKIFNILSL